VTSAESISGEVAAVDPSERSPPSDDPILLELSPRPAGLSRCLSIDCRRPSKEEVERLLTDSLFCGKEGEVGEVTEPLEGLLRNKEGRETGGFDLFEEEEGVETSWGRGRVGGGEGERLLEAFVSSTLGLLDELILLLPESPVSFIPTETDLCSSPLSSFPLLLALLDLLLLNKPDSVTDKRFLDLLDDR